MPNELNKIKTPVPDGGSALGQQKELASQFESPGKRPGRVDTLFNSAR